jgi:hypothetical protein
MGFTALGGPVLARQAVTPAAGVALVNGTPAILTWTAPADGNPHRIMVFASLDITVAQTGGAVTLQMTDPAGTTTTHTVFSGGGGIGSPVSNNPIAMLVQPGSTTTLTQTAQTAGTASLWAELWGG